MRAPFLERQLRERDARELTVRALAALMARVRGSVEIEPDLADAAADVDLPWCERHALPRTDALDLVDRALTRAEDAGEVGGAPAVGGWRA